MKTPKEKAKELVEKYAIWSWNEVYCDYEVAKQSALIAVKEIIYALESCILQHKDDLEYWQEVKQEIESR